MHPRLLFCLLMLLPFASAAGQPPTSGELAYVVGDENGATIYLTDPIARDTRSLVEGRVVPSLLTWSPDGTKLAFIDFADRDTNTNDLFVYDLPTDTLTRLTDHRGDDSAPAWTRDGEALLFTSPRANENALVRDIYRVSASGGEPELLFEDTTERGYTLPLAHPDGERVIFRRLLESPPGPRAMQDERPSEWVIAPLDGSAAPTPYLSGVAEQVGALVWSPAGNRAAYYAPDDNNIYQVFTAPVEEGNPAQVSANVAPSFGGALPAWSPDGDRLAFIENDTDPLVSRIVTAAPDGTDRRVIVQLRGDLLGDTLAWSPDGRLLLYEINGFVAPAGSDPGEPPDPTVHLVDVASGVDLTLRIDGFAREFAWRPTS